MKNHYDILGIQEDASLEKIKQAYRKLSMKFHPDKNDNDVYFSDMFKRITEAYSTLSDVKKREKYDALLKSRRGKTESVNQETQLDPLFFDAALIFFSQLVASTSTLQRKFSIDYSRAENIINQLENEEIIVSFNGSYYKLIIEKQDFETKYDLEIKEVFKDRKASEKTTQEKKTSAPKPVWRKVKTWKRIKRLALLINIVLLGILFKEPLLLLKDPILQKLNLLSQHLNQEEQEEEEVSIEQFFNEGTVTAKNGLRMRVEPNNSSSVITTIPVYETILVLDTNGPAQNILGTNSNWYQIEYENQTGWAWGGFIKKE